MTGRRGTVVIVDDVAAAAEAVADRFAHLARAAIDAQGSFSVALSGGNTPGVAYRLLAGEPYRSTVDWSRVEVWWGDERIVPPDDPDSSYRLARETLLDQVPLRPEHIHRAPVERGDPAAIALTYEAELRRVFAAAVPVFDLILLGIGPDGHTASLFPDSPALIESDRLVADIVGPKPPPRRITFTPAVLNAARERIFLVTGADKAEMVNTILHGPDDPDRWPAQIVRPNASLPLWIIDEAAAARLGG